MGREMALPSGTEEEIWLAKAMAAVGGAVGIPQLCRCVRVYVCAGACASTAPVKCHVRLCGCVELPRRCASMSSA